MDISEQKLSDLPFALEEALRKTKGVLSVQLNAFSRKLVVEFDPSLVSLDQIKEKVIEQAPEGRARLSRTNHKRNVLKDIAG